MGNAQKPKQNTAKKVSGLMMSMFKIGCIGFGGGSALIPVIEREVVEEQKQVTPEDYDKDVVVASITPGALPVEIATGLGKRAYGVRGMMMAALLMSLPGSLVTVLLLSVMSLMSQRVLAEIEVLSIGISSFIACLLTEYAIKTLCEARQESVGRWKRALVILIGVFVLSCGKQVYAILGLSGKPLVCLSTLQVLGMAFFGILYTHCKFTWKHIIVSVVVLGIYLLSISSILPYNNYVGIGVRILMTALALVGLYRSVTETQSDVRLSAKPLAKEMTAWTLMLVVLSIPALILNGQTLLYLGRGLVSSIMSFGGGDAYLSVADGMFVNTEMIQGASFYGHLVPLANLLPGSILCKILTGVGYLLGYEQGGSSVVTGLATALAGFACSVAASGGVFCAIYYVYERFSALNVFRLISRWIRPIISGLLLTVLCSMVLQNIKAGTTLGIHMPWILIITMIIYGLDMLVLLIWKKKNGFLIVLSVMLSLLLCHGAMIVL